MNIKIVQHKHKLDALFAQASTITDMKMQGEWAKYLCVLASGYLENSLRILISEYIIKNSSPKIQSFNEPQISNLTNCKHGKIVKILEQFDVNWSKKYILEIEAKSKITNEIKDCIDSLVQNRHDIAHGKSVSTGYVSVKKYYEKAHTVVEIIDSIIK